MNTAEYVDQKIKELKSGGIPLSEAAWKAALLCVGWPYIFGDRGEYCTPSKRKTVYQKHDDQTSLISKCQALKIVEGVPTITGDCDGCKWFPGGKRVRSYDCRGFTYWILLQIYGWKLMGSGCTSQWNDKNNWKAQGEVEDGIPQGVIVCLFYYKKDEKGKRTKTLSHTGLYYNGETCECSNGVQHSKTLNKKWEVWGVPACVDGDIQTQTPPEPDPQKPTPEPVKKPTLRKGNRNQYVKEMQTDLTKLGYNLGICGIDGDFGSATEKAVKEFQRDHGLTQDGICGPKTWTALEEAVKSLEQKPAEDRYTVTITGLTKGQAEEICKAWKEATSKKE